jgi:metal-responsive CopG/Arc/MetJ family transcriptional regulator
VNRTVNISFEKTLLKAIDKIAKREHRSRSELIREAARKYIEKVERWDSIFKYSENILGNKNLSEKDIITEVKKYRRSKKAS